MPISNLFLNSWLRFGWWLISHFRFGRSLFVLYCKKQKIKSSLNLLVNFSHYCVDMMTDIYKILAMVVKGSTSNALRVRETQIMVPEMIKYHSAFCKFPCWNLDRLHHILFLYDRLWRDFSGMYLMIFWCSLPGLKIDLFYFFICWVDNGFCCNSEH